jgi:hypothetical protein
MTRAPHLRLVQAEPPRPRRIDIRITAFDRRQPIGRTRMLRLTEPDLAWLIDEAERRERAP